MQIQANGYQPLEATRTRSWHYFNFNLVALTRLAQIGQHVGVEPVEVHGTQRRQLFEGRRLPDPGGDARVRRSGRIPELDFRQYAALDVLHAAADAGDKQARAALPNVPVEPGGDLYPIRPAAEQLDNIATS